MTQLNSWCDRGMSLLAGQGIERGLTLEGAQHALKELENFFEAETRFPISADHLTESLKVSQPKDI